MEENTSLSRRIWIANIFKNFLKSILPIHTKLYDPRATFRIFLHNYIIDLVRVFCILISKICNASQLQQPFLAIWTLHHTSSPSLLCGLKFCVLASHPEIITMNTHHRGFDPFLEIGRIIRKVPGIAVASSTAHI